MNPQEQFIHHYKEMSRIAAKQGWGDCHGQSRGKEICSAIHHGHQLAPRGGGADAFTNDGEAVEYKSTQDPRIQGTYNGISVQPTWEEQERYLREEKLGGIPHHYIDRFENGAIVESYYLTGQQVLEVLLPKLEKKFHKLDTMKDPRLGANLSNREILQYGEKVI